MTRVLSILGILLALATPRWLSAAEVAATSVVVSLDGQWLLATDAKNTGREEAWFQAPRPEAKSAKVPWIIQEAFPGYHGVAWYWRDFVPPAAPVEGRTLLRFWAVDYLAEVWLNGVRVGGHEGGETPFVLDVTDAVKPNQKNLLAVRVLNPTNEPIDGIVLPQTARRCKVIPFSAGAIFNTGGITDSVELLAVGPVRVEDLWAIARPEPKTGNVHVRVNVRNAGKEAGKGVLTITVSPASSGETLTVAEVQRDFPAGDTPVELDLTVDNPHLWNLNDPYLYRVTARVQLEGSRAMDERSTRCGFRDFRLSDGYFRLNGRRIYLRCSHTCNHYPIGIQLPQDPDLVRRDLLNMKVMGFNAIRFIWGGASRVQLDLCDEIGLLVYEESYASNPIADSPKMIERFDTNVAELIRRDRNHPSIVMWGLLNESQGGPDFQHAITMLPLVRSLDDTRMVMLNSGRYDIHGGSPAGPGAVGSIANPGSTKWEDVLSDRHIYPRVPHTAEILQSLRWLKAGEQPVFLSEYGIGSAVDLWRAVRHFEQRGAEGLEDAQYFNDKLNRFLADWKCWRLDEMFNRPEDFFMESLKKMASQRTLGLNAIRSNPNIVGHSLTGAIDHVMCGEGLTTLFRELKPGTIDAMFDAWAPLRWCLFAEPVHVARGSKIRLEAVLANEDALSPGEYPARLQVIGPNMSRILDRTITVRIPKATEKPEPPLAQACFAEDVTVDGPAGKYQFLATFERGAAAAGGSTEFFVTDPAEMPAVEAQIVLWGEDPALAKWLAEHGIRTRPYAAAPPAMREVILAASKPAAPGGAEAFRELAGRIARGATVVFLAPEVFASAEKPLAWLPLAKKGSLTAVVGWLYLKDEWCKRHAIFEGMPSGGLMDYGYYREIIPNLVLLGQDPPGEAVAGAIKASQGYDSGLMLSVYNLGEGRFILNTLRIRENLGVNPPAERLLRNVLRYAARDTQKPLANLPADFEGQLKAMGLR